MNHPQENPPAARFHLVPVALVALVACLLYARVRGYGFVDFDDTTYLVENAVVREGLSLAGILWAFTSLHAANWHPLTWLSHMLDVSLFGLEPGPHHLVNVALHALNGALFYALGWRLFGRRDAALVAALLFVVHPQHVESVVWLAERKDLLCAAFWLLALLAWCDYARRPGTGPYLLVMAAFAAALLSKPMAVSLPLVLLLLDAWPLQRLGQGVPRELIARAVEKLPLVLMALGSCALTLVAQQRGGAVTGVDVLPLAERAANAVVACALYLRDFVKPDRLAVFYPLRPVDVATGLLPAAAVLAGAGWIAWRLRATRPALLIGLGWTLVTLLPVIGLVQVGAQARADRYMYIPSMGLLLALAALLPQPGQRAWRAAIGGCVAAGAFWAVLCHVQIGYWATPTLLYVRAVEVTGDNPFAESRLVAALVDAGRVEEAKLRADSLLARHPENGEAHMNLGNIAMVQDRLAEAERWFRAARARSPRHPFVLNNLGVVLIRQGRVTEGCAILAEAASILPESTLVLGNLATGGCTSG